MVLRVEPIKAPAEDSERGGLWIILKDQKDTATLVESDFSSWKPTVAYEYAHNLALDYAEGVVSLSRQIAEWPLVTPDSKLPGRTKEHITLTKIIDNSRSVLNRENTDLVEYTKEPVLFVL